jgi:16S rRNA G966 N2-methylase RsmD
MPIYERVMEDLFPRKDGIDFSKLEITEVGSYSITRRRDAERIMNILKNKFQDISNLSITDSTACIGGDTINFALHFKSVTSIELEEQNFKCLKNNVEVYNFNNVKLHHGDSTVLFNWNTDILYIDPPWGGKDYKNQKNIDLFLSKNIRIDKWIEEILKRKNRPSFIILKLPSNYRFNVLNFLPNVETISSHQIRSYVLIIIQVHPYMKNGLIKS